MVGILPGLIYRLFYHILFLQMTEIIFKFWEELTELKL
jgi:hypothetical protein